MVFKNFRLQIVLRVIVLMLVLVVLAWCFTNGLYLRSGYLVAGAIALVVEFIVYVDRFNRDVKTFLISLQQQDFSTHYQSSGRGKSYDELYEALNNISASFKKVSKEKEIQHRYLEMLVDHVRVGILSIDETGKIHLANNALKSLLRTEVLVNLKSLEIIDQSLANAVLKIRTGETQLVKVRVQNEMLQLSVHASEFRLEERYFKLISMQNISNELDVREMEAWQKLIRVLSHEIMNSVSPITSLSQTLHGLVHNKSEFEATELEALDKGLEAIRIRSEGLFNFTQSYRKLTGVPQLKLNPTSVQVLFHRVKTLLNVKLQEAEVDLKISGLDETIVVDPNLMEQVLINLLLNAMEAVKSKNTRLIQLYASKNERGSVVIHVRDNGEGMDEATVEKIFIPFFTTRKNGSGIGLALTKQILQLHKADIHVRSRPEMGTEFQITL